MRYFGAATVQKSKTLRDAVAKCRELAESLPGTKTRFEALVGVTEEASAEE